jgi:large subunit ribosomal protein L13
MESEVGTYFAKTRRSQVRWRVIDAEGAVLGRLAARASRVLTGKDSADYTPHADHRDGIIIVNAEKVRLTGRKLEQKMYRHYTGYPGGLREVGARKQLETKPERLIRDAILGMLPKSRMGARLAGRLKVYAGPTHPHQGQTPESISFAR